jgi:hypothetical protein
MVFVVEGVEMLGPTSYVDEERAYQRDKAEGSEGARRDSRQEGTREASLQPSLQLGMYPMLQRVSHLTFDTWT